MPPPIQDIPPTTPASLNPNDVVPPPSPSAPTAPTNQAELEAELSRVRKSKLEAAYAWDEYRRNNPDVKVGEGGQVYRQAPGKTSFDMAGGPTSEMSPQYDVVGTNKYLPFYQLDQQEKLLEQAMKDKIFGSGEAGMSYVDSEKLKQDEAKKEFTDAITRIKALYDVQDQEGEWMQENAKSNQDRAKGIMEGNVDRASSIIRPTFMPPGSRMSDVIEPSMPDKIPPYYSMSEAVGLPGQEGLGGGISGYAQGTGFAKLPSVSGTSNSSFKSPGGIDPEVGWMIGMPDVPVLKSYLNMPRPEMAPTPPAALNKAKQSPAAPGFSRLA